MSDLPLFTRKADERIAELESQLEAERAVPDGWQLVPVEPTEEILAAMYNLGIDDNREDLQDIYKSILAAAPGAGGGE